MAAPGLYQSETSELNIEAVGERGAEIVAMLLKLHNETYDGTELSNDISLSIL